MNKENLVKIIAILLAGAAIGGGIAYAVMPKGKKPKEDAEDEYVYKNKNDCELRRKQFISSEIIT
ncbi:MAG: hypothetical protein ACTTKP_08750 [Catonella sp.]|uniref:hypothetical protein n=1 Tax=Catonella sp. TaxID=2382125 RepID=UPI003FA13E39